MKRERPNKTIDSKSHHNPHQTTHSQETPSKKQKIEQPTTQIGSGILQGKFVFDQNDNNNISISAPSTFSASPAKTETATGKRPGSYPKLDVKQNILNPLDRLNMLTNLVIEYGCNSNVIADYENGLWQYIYDDLKQQTNIAGSNRPNQFLTLVLQIMKHLCVSENWWSSSAYALLTFARKPNESPAQWAKKFTNHFDAVTFKGKGLPFTSFTREILTALPSLLNEPLFPIKEYTNVYEFLNKVQALPTPINTTPTPTVVVTAEPKPTIINRNNNTHDSNNRRDFTNNRQNNQNNQNQRSQTKPNNPNQTQCWFHKLSDTDKRSFSHQAVDCTTLQNLTKHLGRQIVPTTDTKELNELHQIAISLKVQKQKSNQNNHEQHQ